MFSPIVQFDNVRKHYQMGLVTVKALRGVAVAQIFNLVYRRIEFCGRREVLRPSGLPTPCRFQIGDTADCKSALRVGGKFIDERIEIKRGLKGGEPGL